MDFTQVTSICAYIFIQDGRYVPYKFEMQKIVWTTSHNKDHGYVRDIIAVGVNGKLCALFVHVTYHLY